jgi:hypothetical protein
MKIYDVKQGSPEWLALRAGIPTASEFHRILTAKKLEISTQAEKYRARLIAERIIGRPIEDIEPSYESEYMRRGSDLELQAIKAYECDTEQDTVAVGFCTRDDGRAGASPDRLVPAARGSVEMKCPALSTHVGYLLNPQTLVDKYRPQALGQLWVGEGALEWNDLCSYHPMLPMVRVRLYPKPEIQQAIGAAMEAFCQALFMAYEQLVQIYGPFTPPTPVESSKQLLTADDEELIIEGLKKEGKI